VFLTTTLNKVSQLHAWGNLRERNYLENIGVDGRIILKRIFKKWDRKGMDWIHLALGRDR
jgi:hypothetical protein